MTATWVEPVPGILRMGTPLINWYLVADDDGVTVVDAGAPAYRRQLEPGLAQLGRTVADVRAVILTHGAGCVAFHFERHDALILGDVLFEYNVLTGRRGPQISPAAFNTSSEQALASLDRLEPVQAGSLLFGHGDPWTGGTAAAVDAAR